MRTEITINGADNAGANYIAWAPVHSNIRLVEADEGVDFIDVLLQNQNPNQGGQLLFFDAIPGAGQARLQLRLPTNGTPVNFFIAGKFLHPSTADKDAVIEVVNANTSAALSTKALMVRIRKNANNLTEGERNRFLSALATLNDRGMGRFSDFRNMHTSAADPEAHGRAGFLPWHRAYVLDLERELQRIDPSVALPYWKFDEPAPKLFTRAFLGVPNTVGTVQFDPGNPLEFWVTDQALGIVRMPRFNTNTSQAGGRNEAATLLLGGAGNLYTSFRDVMELNPHGSAHTSFRGFISRIATAAKDPLFFLLHANVDRLWAKWQWFFKRFDTANPAAYPFLGRAGDPGAIRVGHNLKDTMWPWNQVTGGDRPATAPGGTLATSPTANAPGPMPTVGDMIDYQGVINSRNRLGFGYSDVPFGSR
jgi:tyrosinase